MTRSRSNEVEKPGFLGAVLKFENEYRDPTQNEHGWLEDSISSNQILVLRALQ
jgi:hypothetical protein